jgi:hypothetical protein
MGAGVTSPGCCNCGYGYPSGSGGQGTTPFCFCTALPETLTMFSCDETSDFGIFQSCTLQYGPTPSVYASLGLGANIYLSTTGFADPNAGGALFYYSLTCQGNQIGLTQLYPAYPGVGPLNAGVIYGWHLGSVGSGNYCGTNTLAMAYGTPFSGASAFDCVVIYGGTVTSRPACSTTVAGAVC